MKDKLELTDLLISFAYWGSLKPKPRLKKVKESAKMVKKNPLDNSELKICSEILKSIKRKERDLVIHALNVGIDSYLKG